MTVYSRKSSPLSPDENSSDPVIVKEFRDKRGRVISIRKTSNAYILGSVLFLDGKVVIIPHSRIVLPTGGVLSDEVLNRMGVSRRWHFIYDDTANKIVIWL